VRSSKDEAGDELKGSGVAGEDAGEVVEGAGAGDQESADAGERGEVDVIQLAGDKLGMIKDVESLHAKLKVRRFADGELLDQGHIEIINRVDAQGIAAGIAERAQAGGDITGVGIIG